MLPGIHSVSYQTEWEGSGNRSGWARERRWAIMGRGGRWRSLRGARWCKLVLETS